MEAYLFFLILFLFSCIFLFKNTWPLKERDLKKLSLNFFFKFVLCNRCRSAPSLTILLRMRLSIFPLVFLYAKIRIVSKYPNLLTMLTNFTPEVKRYVWQSVRSTNSIISSLVRWRTPDDISWSHFQQELKTSART